MKILLGVPEYPPYHIGGGGEVFKQLAENYKKMGHEVVVMYGYYPTKSWRDEVREYRDKNGIKFFQIPEIPYPKSASFLRTVMPVNFRTWKKIKLILTKEKPDVAHLHGYGLLFVNQLARALQNCKIKYLLTLHGAPVSPGKMGGITGLLYYFYKLLPGRALLENADEITAVSEYTKTFSEFKKFAEKIIVINNGIDVDEFANFQPTNNPYKKFIKVGNDKEFIFLSLGRIEWLKGFQFFIKIIPDLVKMGYNPKYFIAGRDNGMKKELLTLIEKVKLEKNVFFLGQLDSEAKKNALYYTDFVIVPSLVENFPAVPLEAMAFGKIPIINDAGGMPEMIVNNVNGIVVEVEKRKKFIGVIKKLLEEKKTDEMEKRNLRKIRKRSWVEISEKYLERLKRVFFN